MTMSSTSPVYFLLVDDLEENLLSLEALLRREGLVLLKAKSGNEALEFLLKYEVALALLDVQMPGMDGFELAEIMRGIERTRRVPIIFLTAGSADYQRRFRGYETGAVDFIHKPIEPDILRSKVQVFFELQNQQNQLIAQRDELKRITEALREADRQKDEFIATLAHELRNPLAPIRTGLHVLRMLPEGEKAEQVRNMMERQLLHLVRLIDDLLDISRVSQGKIDLRRDRITLQSILQSAIEGSSPFIEQAKHTFTTDIPEQDVWLDGDAVRLAQIVSNLLNNAAKYTPEGGHITLTAHEEDGHAVIRVKDDGLGICPEMITAIFQLFTQIGSHLSHSQGGLGIGLALVKRLAEMHGGTVKAESPGLGKGSVFTLCLPLAAAKDETASDAHDTAHPASATALTVLVVDDNLASAQTSGWMMELIGHKPVLVHDGLEALERAKELQPDAILLDIGLPGMDGYAVCAELRKDPRFKDTLIIAQTGWGQERDRQQALKAGFNHHLVKPVDLDKLSALLATHIKKTS